MSTPGPLVVSATLLGWAPARTAVSRAGARVGDGLYVTGVIGDGGLGLRAARGELAELGPDAVQRLARRYRLPEPRVELAERVRGVATASADVSDGLLADAGHIATASGVRMAVDLAAVPMSTEARAWLTEREAPAAVVELATAGDDYEIVFTAGPEHAAEAGGIATRVGEVRAGAGLEATWNGAPMQVGRLGWRHG